MQEGSETRIVVERMRVNESGRGRGTRSCVLPAHTAAFSRGFNFE
jgi:hypothetical protein